MSTSAAGATVVICSPHALMAEGLVKLLDSSGYRVSPVCLTLDSLLETLSSVEPDIVLLGGPVVQDGTSIIRELAEQGCAVAVLIGSEKGVILREAYMAGAKGCISLDVSPEQFCETVHLLLQGATILSARPGELMLDAARTKEEYKLAEKLSDRERQLAILVARGESNREIGEALSISEHTVRIHLENILTKLDLRNRQQLAVYVAREGSLEDIPVW